MNKLICFVFAVLACSPCCHGVNLTSVVQTTLGPIQGFIDTTIWNNVSFSAFLGVPYAKPPLGLLRFQPPVAPDPWFGVYPCINDTSACPQIDGYSNLFVGHEDCLYLNVYTPKTNFLETGNLLPVMVWIFGGSFSWGYDNITFYGPDFFIEEDVVFVNMNYRMGALGYLYLNHSEAMGNAALKDQVAALQWVHDNIQAFGGDPNNVTLFGESSGAASVFLHVLSPMSEGLFNGVIAQSGVPLYFLFQSPTDAYSSATRLAALFGQTSTDPEVLLEFYRTIDAADLVNAQNSLDILPDTKMEPMSFPEIGEKSCTGVYSWLAERSGLPAQISMPFRATVENVNLATPTSPVFLNECPITLIQNGEYTKRNMMMGFMYNELLFGFQFAYDIANITASVMDFFDPLHPLDLQGYYNVIQEVAFVSSGVTMTADIDLGHRLFSQTNTGHPIYYYMISYKSEYYMHQFDNVVSKEAAHYDDIGILFNVKMLNAPTDPTDPFNVFRAKVVKLWTNFAKYGNPTPDYDNPISPTVWEPSGTAGRQLNISDECVMMDRDVGLSTVLAEELFYVLLPSKSGCSSISTNVNFTTTFLSGL